MLPSAVWSADELLREAGPPKSDIALCCGWTWTRSTPYKQLVADLRTYGGMRAHPTFRRPRLSGHEARLQIYQLRTQLEGIYHQAQRYLRTPGQSRYLVIQRFSELVREELEVLARTNAEMPAEDLPEGQSVSLQERRVQAANMTTGSEPVRQQFYETELILLDFRPGRQELALRG